MCFQQMIAELFFRKPLNLESLLTMWESNRRLTDYIFEYMNLYQFCTHTCKEFCEEDSFQYYNFRIYIYLGPPPMTISSDPLM